MEYTFIDGDISPLVAEFGKHNSFSFDLETTGLTPIDSRILLAQFGFRGGINYVVAVHKIDLTNILPFLLSPKWETIIHNAKFEQKFIQHYYRVDIQGVFDTQLSELIIAGNQHVSSSLAFCAQKYLNIVLEKETRNSFIDMNPIDMFTDEQLEYAARDVDILFGIRDIQEQKLKEDGLLDIARVEFDLTAVVANMENVGVPIDSAKWRTKLVEAARDHEASRLKITDMLFKDNAQQAGMFEEGEPLDEHGKPVNINSPQQIGRSLVRLGIDLPKTDKGSLKTDERTLSNIKHPATQEIVAYRGLQKILSSYGEKSFLEKIHPFTGRIHAEWKQIGTETGRFACEKPNLQQLPDAFRQCILDPHFKIVVADYSQIELRIIAEMSGDVAMIAAFNSEHDLHTATAATMFNVSPEKVDKDQRFTAKTINFGLAYGMGPDKLLDTLNGKREKGNLLTLPKVNALISKHKAAFQVAVTFLKDSGLTAYRQGYSTTLLGRRRYFPKPSGDDPKFNSKIGAIKREGANAPIQGTNADITKIAMVNLHRELRDYKHRADIILAVHDEIVVLAHKTEAESVKYLVEQSMVESARTVLTKVPIAVEAFIVDYWRKG